MHSFHRTTSDASDIQPPPPYHEAAIGGNGRHPSENQDTTRGIGAN